MNYDFTKEEVTALTQIIDLGIKYGGLSCAEAGVLLVKKLNTPNRGKEIEPSGLPVLPTGLTT